MVTHLIGESNYTRHMSGAKLVKMTCINLKQTLRTEYPHFVRVNLNVAIDTNGAEVTMRNGWRYVKSNGKEYRVSRLRWPTVARVFGLSVKDEKQSLPRERIMTLLQTHPRLHISELAQLTDRTPSSTSTLVNGLRKQGWVKSKRDGFRVYVSLPNG